MEVQEQATLKRCPSCKKEKGRYNFHKNAARYDGLQSICKDCRKNNNGPRKSIGESEFANA